MNWVCNHCKKGTHIGCQYQMCACADEDHPRRPGPGSRTREAVLEFVQAFAAANGYPPTLKEIGAGVGLSSPSSVKAHLARLQRDGLIARDPFKSRAIKVVRPELAPVVPINGERQ